MNTAYVFYNDPEGQLERIEVPDHPLTIGSHEICGLVLSGKSVGPIHVAVERGPDGARVRRLSRVKNVTLNGDKIDAEMADSGAEIGLGNVALRYVDAPAVSPKMLNIKVSRGEDEIQVDLPVAGSVIVVGRIRGDILIDDDVVSGEHLEIENFGSGLRWVRDLGSTNGTELNGQPLSGVRQPLEDGAVITIGGVTLEIRDGGDTPEEVTDIVQRNITFVKDSARA